MKILIKVFAIVLLIACASCDKQGSKSKSDEYRVTETSTLYQFDGGVVSSKMQSKKDGKTIYSMNIKINGLSEYTQVTKNEYDSFDLGDTIKIEEKDIPSVDEDTTAITEINECGYKIVTIGGENYLVIKLQDNVSINNTIFK